MAFVLVADSSPVVGRFIRIAVAPEGHQVIRAALGEVALEIIAQTAPDLVIMDTQLDDMDGKRFYAALRESGYHRSVLVLSADDAQGFAAEVGAEAALQKPFDVEDLVVLLRRLIGDG